MRLIAAMLLGLAACCVTGCGGGLQDVGGRVAARSSLAVDMGLTSGSMVTRPVGPGRVLVDATPTASPVPAIASISPLAGRVAAGIVVTITGSGLTEWTTLTVNGVLRPCKYLDDKHVSVQLSADDVAQAGVLQMQLQNAALLGGGTSGTATYTVSNPPPVLEQLGTADFAAGSTPIALPVQAVGMLPGVTATIDGVPRQLVQVDSIHVSVAITADDLLYAATRSLRLVNPGPGDARSAVAILTVHNPPKQARKYVAFGDSNTSGYGPAGPAGLAYPNLLAAANGLSLQANMAGFGIQACDIFPAQIYPIGVNSSSTERAVSTLMVGENDLFRYGTGPHEQTFSLCHQASIAWLALPAESKTWLANPAGLSATGSCAAALDRLATIYCSGAGTISRSALVSYGHPLYVWYLLDDEADAAAAFTVQVDGAEVATAQSKPFDPIATGIGIKRSVGLLRIPVLAGTHDVVVTTMTGGVGILAFGTAPASDAAMPFVIVGDVVDGLAGANVYDPVAQAKYNADIRANVMQFKEDGLDVRYASTGAYMLGSPEEMADPVHMSILGHQHLAAAFQTGFADLLP